MTNNEIRDEIILKHVSDSEPVDVNGLCDLTKFPRFRVKESLDRLEKQQIVRRKKDIRGYVFALQEKA